MELLKKNGYYDLQGNLIMVAENSEEGHLISLETKNSSIISFEYDTLINK